MRELCPGIADDSRADEFGLPPVTKIVCLSKRMHTVRCSLGRSGDCVRQGAGRAHQSGKIPDRHHPGRGPIARGADLSLCTAVERIGNCAQDPEPARHRNLADNGARSCHRNGIADHHLGACLRGMGRLGLAGLCDRGGEHPAPNGSRAHLCPALCAVHARRDRR